MEVTIFDSGSSSDDEARRSLGDSRAARIIFPTDLVQHYFVTDACTESPYEIELEVAQRERVPIRVQPSPALGRRGATNTPGAAMAAAQELEQELLSTPTTHPRGRSRGLGRPAPLQPLHVPPSPAASPGPSPGSSLGSPWRLSSQLPPPPGYASTSCLSLGCRRSCPGHGHLHTHGPGGLDPYVTDSVLNGDLDLDAMTTPYGVTRGRYRSATSGRPLRPYAASLSPPSRNAVHHHHHHHHHYHYQADQAAGRRSGAPHSAGSALPHRRPTSMSSVSLPYTGTTHCNGAVTAAQGPPAGKAQSRSSSSHAPYTPTLSHQHASPRARSGSAGSGGSGHGLSHSSHAPSPPYGASVSSSSTAAAAAATADTAAAAAWQLQHAREWQDWRLAAAAAGSEPGHRHSLLSPTQRLAPTPTKSTAAAAAAPDGAEGVQGGIPSTAEADANTATEGTEGGSRCFKHAPSFAWMTRASSPSASSPDAQSPRSSTISTGPEQHVPGQSSGAASTKESREEDSVEQLLVSPGAHDRRRVSPHRQKCDPVSMELALDVDTALDVSWDLVQAANVAAEAAAEAAQAACQAAEWLQEHAPEHVHSASASMELDIEQGWRGAAARQQREGLATNIRDSATSVDLGACASGRGRAGLYDAPGGTAWGTMSASVGSPASVSSAGPRPGWGSIVIADTPASPIHSIHSNGLFREAAASPAGAGRSAAGSRLASPSPLPHRLPPFADGPMGQSSSQVGRSQEAGSPEDRLGFEVRATPGGVTITTVMHGAEGHSDDEERGLPVGSVEREAEAGAVGRGRPPALELPGGRGAPPLALQQEGHLQGAWPAGAGNSLPRDTDGMLDNPLYRLPSGAGDDDDPHSGRYAFGRSGSGRSCRSHSTCSSHPDSPSSHVSGYRVAATPDGGTLVTLGRRARQHSRMVPLHGPAGGDECLRSPVEEEEGEQRDHVEWTEGALRQERYSVSIGAGFDAEEYVGECGLVGADGGEGEQELESPVEGDELTPHLPPVQLPPSPGESCGLLPGTPLEAHLGPHLPTQISLRGRGSPAGSLAGEGAQQVDRPLAGGSWVPATPADSGSESEDSTFLPPPPSPGEVLPLPSPELPMPPCPAPAERPAPPLHEAQDSHTGTPSVAAAPASVLEADGLEGLAQLRASALAKCARAMGARAGETSRAVESEERCLETLGHRLEATRQAEAARQAAMAVVVAEAACAAACAMDGQARAAAALEGMCEQRSQDLGGLASEEGAAAAAGVCAAAREAAAVRGLALGRVRRMANVVAPAVGAAAADSAAAGLAEAEAVRGALQAIEQQTAERAAAAAAPAAAVAAAAAAAEQQRRAAVQAGRRERRAVRSALRAAEAGSARVAVAAGAAEEAACCRLVERLAVSRLAVTLDTVAEAAGVQAAACTAAGLAEQLAVDAALCAKEVVAQEQQQQRAALQASRRERRALRAELNAKEAAASASGSATADAEQAACLAAGRQAEEARVARLLELVSGAAGEQAVAGVRSGLAEQATALCAGQEVMGPAPNAAAAACSSAPSHSGDSAGRGSKHGARRGKAGKKPVVVATVAAAACVGAAAAEAPAAAAAAAAAATPAADGNPLGGADAEAPVVPVVEEAVVQAAGPLEPGVAVEHLAGEEAAGPVHGVQGDDAAPDSPPDGPNTPCAKGREAQGALVPEGHRASAEDARQQGCAAECTGRAGELRQAAGVTQEEGGMDEEEEDEQETPTSWAGFGVGLLAVTGLFTGSVLYLGSGGWSCAAGRGCGAVSARGSLHPSQLPNATCTAPWLLTKAVYGGAQQRPVQKQLQEAFAGPEDPLREAGGAEVPPVQQEQPAANAGTFVDDSTLPQAGQDLASSKAGAGESAEATVATAAAAGVVEVQAMAEAETETEAEAALQAEAQAQALLSHPQYAASQVPGWLMRAFMRPGGGVEEGGAAAAGELEQLLEPEEESTGEMEGGGPWAGDGKHSGSGITDADAEGGEPTGAVGEEASGSEESVGAVVELEGQRLWEEAEEAAEAVVVGTWEPEPAQREDVAALGAVSEAGGDGQWTEAEGGQQGADDEAAAEGLSGASAVPDVQQQDASASAHEFPPPEAATAANKPNGTLAADSGPGVPPAHAPAQHFAYAGLSLAACVSGCVAALLAAGRVGRRAATAAAVHVRHVWDVDPRSPPLPMPYTHGSDGLPSRRPPRVRTAVAAAGDAFGYLGAAVGAAAAFAGGAGARAANRQQPQHHHANNWDDDGYDGWYGGQYDDMDAGDPQQNSPSRRSPSRGMGTTPADFYWLRPNLMVPRASPARSFGGSLRSGGPHGEGSSGGGGGGGHRQEDEPSVHCGAAGGVEFHWLRNRTVWSYDDQAMSREARALVLDSPMFRRARQ